MVPNRPVKNVPGFAQQNGPVDCSTGPFVFVQDVAVDALNRC
jgi:hypothetical protein